MYKTEQEYDERLKSDAMAMAELLYNIYQDKKRKEANDKQQ